MPELEVGRSSKAKKNFWRINGTNLDLRKSHGYYFLKRIMVDRIFSEIQPKLKEFYFSHLLPALLAELSD